jgi:hypothetical protein
MPIKVLIVLDGEYRFGESATPEGSKDFTFITLVNTLTAAGMQVTKAHRRSDSTADAGKENFDFAGAGVNLLDFDVLWLIGFEGRNAQVFPPSGASTMGGLGATQLNAIAQFMEHGGGVFATGDHDSIGADMSGYIPRVRAMRCWYGQGDSAKPSGLASIEPNFPPLTTRRADTTRTNPAGVYIEHPEAAPFLWFENQSDSVPQPIMPTSPTHPILRRNGADIVVYPDHMHEGKTLGEVPGHDYTQNSPFGDTSKAEFREVAGNRPLPRVIATGQVLPHSIFTADGSAGTDTTQAEAKSVNTLSVYDGRAAGVGRIVTGSTFHHYIDINLTGDFDINSTLAMKVGSDAMKGHGFNDAPAIFDNIKAVYVNITNWLARPRPAVSLILERSTFSQDELTVTSQFDGAILLTVDGLKPTQFPGTGTGIPALGAISGMPDWVPTIVPTVAVPIVIEPTFVSSDDPTMPDRLQRFTFTYRVRFTGDAFGFGGNSSTVPVQATLNSSAFSAPLTDNAWLQLVKSANPFMLDLADSNTTTWLSSDVKVFHVVSGQDFLGVNLPLNATRDQALTFIRTLATNITSAQFTALPSAEEDSSLSLLEMTTGTPPKRVYNFALARVRLSSAGADALVRVFFRIFTTQTTAALTYHLDGGGMPIEGYRKSADADPIALPGTQNGGTEWVSFPFFARTRTTPQQQDTHTIKDVEASVGFKVFGALIDNNLTDPYLTQTPLGGPVQSLPTLMMGEHQCIVAQIEFAGAPIPDGATPWTSDKLSQRNIAMSTIANPGLDASRVAMHTFEIEATPYSIGDALPPDELLLDWSAATPGGTVLRLHIPSWNARDVVELADRFYPRHDIDAIDEHTIEMPSGGTRYVPIPVSHHRQTGVIAVEFPLGVRKGQRFDVSVRQVTNRVRNANVPPPRVQKISLEEAEKIVASLAQPAGAVATGASARGVDLGDNKVLVTDLSVFDAVSDHALIIEHPDPKEVRAAMRDAGRWRETIGAFQLGMPVSTRGAMLLYHMQLLSVMRWRTAHLPHQSRWRKTMLHYLDLLAVKVQALGGDPFAVPATPDGAIPQLPGKDGDGGNGSGDIGRAIEVLIKELFRRRGCWLLLLIILLIILLLLIWYFFA